MFVLISYTKCPKSFPGVSKKGDLDNFAFFVVKKYGFCDFLSALMLLVADSCFVVLTKDK